MDWEKHQVSIDGKEVHLTPMEYKILKLLIDNRGKVLTHNYILSQIWGSAQGVEASQPEGIYGGTAKEDRKGSRKLQIYSDRNRSRVPV